MTNEPIVSVGIVTAPYIRFAFHAAYVCGTEAVPAAAAVETVTATAVGLRWRGQLYHELVFTPEEADTASFSLYDVTIGKGFHWQRQEVQTFQGALRFVKEGAEVCAVNVLPVEAYLASVISSEMSPTASLEFLKAHAVISRSWLLAQIGKRGKATATSSVPPTHAEGVPPVHADGVSPVHAEAMPSTQAEDVQPVRQAGLRRPGMLVKWYNHDDHALYDVCADDHCQRYQGITKVRNPRAYEAIRQTRGRVLMYDGDICDARFSKCCGGRMEQFSSCWEDEDKPYLVSKPDIINDVRARGVDEAFCNTSDPAILSQVLNNFDQETTDFYHWTVRYTQEELSQLVARKSGIDFGRILSLHPVRRGPSGRIVMLEIVGTRQTLTVGKELEIRKWLSPSHLYSSAFDVSADGADGTPPAVFTFSGKGWGHGVGLCQIGAAVMGVLGYGYDEMLSHYYPHAQLSVLYG